MVEYEGDRLRTFTAPYVYDPEWPEQEFSFKVADKDSLGPLKVFLYAEVRSRFSGDGRTPLPPLFLSTVCRAGR